MSVATAIIAGLALANATSSALPLHTSTPVPEIKKPKKKKIYENQKLTAQQIYEKFLDDHYNYGMLFAQMQSGKSGTALWTGYLMIMAGKIDRVVITSGTSDTTLKNQWEKNRDEIAEEFAKEYVIRHWASELDLTDLIDLQNNIKEELIKKLKSFGARTLRKRRPQILIKTGKDESHGITQGQTRY